MRVTVVIASRAGSALLAECLPAVLSQRVRADEIVVVDDGAGDDAEFVERRFPSARALRLPARLGHAGAVSAGIAASRGEVIALLNNDTMPAKGWLEEALRPLADPQVGSVATLLVRAEDPSRVDSAGDAYSCVGLAWKRLEGEPVAEVRRLDREPFSACAGAALYRRSALLACGGFDSRLEAYYDDVDVGARLRLAGWRSVLAPEARCCHHVSASYGALPSHREFLIARNSSIVRWSTLPPRLLWRGLAGSAMLIALQAANRGVAGGLAPFLRGKLAAFGRPGVLRARRRWVRRLSLPHVDLGPALDPGWAAVLRQRAARSHDSPPARLAQPGV